MATVEPRPQGESVGRAGERASPRAIATTTAIVVAVVLAIAGVLLGVWLVRETVVWLVAAGFLAFSIEPLVRMSQRRGLGRGAATALAFVIVAVVVLVFAFAIIPPVVDGARELRDKIPAYVDQLQDTSTSDTLHADGAIESAGDTADETGDFFTRAN